MARTEPAASTSTGKAVESLPSKIPAFCLVGMGA